LVANFISGILLLFERTVRPGDMIEVGGQKGVVDKLRMRSTVIRTFDNTEIFVPNKNLLTSSFTAYTQTDRVVRRLLDIGVSYNSDPTQVRNILLEVANRHGLVLKKPEPLVFFLGFGASSLNFQLAIWVDDPSHGLRVTSDLFFMIWNEFEKYDIEIPFPQQDLHLRSGPWDTFQGEALHGHHVGLANGQSEERNGAVVDTTASSAKAIGRADGGDAPRDKTKGGEKAPAAKPARLNLPG
ncbi:MAG: mechanosensitive ion channel, partial [Caldilineaceae bacterium]|nr:mechanosensitive ion channel [Caldilineaceae bacterium]